MKRSRFSEEQIIGILKEHQASFGAKELYHGTPKASANQRLQPVIPNTLNHST